MSKDDSKVCGLDNWFNDLPFPRMRKSERSEVWGVESGIKFWSGELLDTCLTPKWSYLTDKLTL